MKQIKCPKCNGNMEQGLIKSDGGYAGDLKWGKPDSVSGWTGKVKDGKKIVTYRCQNCGYLECYAE
jgi:predicted nucleic-acid-binding Zn-ribbon protein